MMAPSRNPNALRKLRAAAVAALIFAASPATGYQLVMTTGYANSGKPETGQGVVRGAVFDAGGGLTAGVRLEAESPHLYVGPSFLFWNNLTGSTYEFARANYFQIELGGRLSYRTVTVPTLYAGAGLGYSFAHGEFRYNTFYRDELPVEEYDGDFPTASVHIGMKTDTKQNGIGALGELSYHWGLDHASGRRAIGPARAFLVQIGVVFDSNSLIEP